MMAVERMKDCGVDKSGSLFGLRYTEFVVPLVKAVQEHQELIETQENKMSVQENKLSTQKYKLSA